MVLELNRNFSQYNPNKMDKKRGGKLELINRSILSCDGDFVTKELLEKKCYCAQKSTCYELLRLLKDGNRPEVQDSIALHNDLYDK